MNIKLKLKLNAYSKVDLTNVLTAENLQAILNNYYTAERDETTNVITIKRNPDVVFILDGGTATSDTSVTA